MKPFIFLLLLIFVMPEFACAQSLRLSSPDGKPLEGALITYSTLNNTGSVTFISDRNGQVAFPSLSFPLVRTIRLLGFVQQTDTLRQDKPDAIILQPSARELGEVTITDSYQPGYQSNTVQKVEVINRDMIDRRAAVTLSDLLTQELGMRNSNDPVLGSSINMQGLGGENVKILVDGVPVIGRKNGVIDLGQLNLANVERVEIIKGPMSVLYGTDALGGVINLVSKKNKTGRLNAQLNGYTESNGIYNTDLSAGAGFGKSSVNVSGGRNFFDGWDAVDTGRAQQWKPKEQYFGDLRFQHSFKSTTIGFQSNYLWEKVINKSNTIITPYTAYASDQFYRTWRYSQQLNAEHRFNANSSLQFAGTWSSYKYIKNTYRKNMVDLTEQLTPDPLDDDTTKFNAFFSRAVFNYNGNHAISFLGGAEYNYENAKGERIDNKMHDMQEIAAFASGDVSLPYHITLRPAARVIYNSIYKAPVVPSFNLVWKPATVLTVRAGWSAGFRAPSLKELYLNFVDNGVHNVHGNTNLLAETSQNLVASVEWNKAHKNTVLTVTPSVFYTDVKNRISLVQADPSSSLYQYLNLDRFFTRGTEIKVRVASVRASFETGYAYTGTNGSFEGQVSQPAIAWYGEANASASYKLKNTGTVFSLFWKYIGEQPIYILTADNTLTLYKNQDYSLVDFSVMQAFHKNLIIVSGGIKNILDVKDVHASAAGGVHSGANDGNSPAGMGTTAFIKLTLNIR